jgi:hypothetical protein
LEENQPKITNSVQKNPISSENVHFRHKSDKVEIFGRERDKNFQSGSKMSGLNQKNHFTSTFNAKSGKESTMWSQMPEKHMSQERQQNERSGPATKRERRDTAPKHGETPKRVWERHP